MEMKRFFAVMIILAGVWVAGAQTEAAFENKTGQSGLLDPSRLSVHHSASFGMSSASNTSLRSQSLYTTMMQYRFNAPVTLNLNFSLPIHSSFSKQHNLSTASEEPSVYFNSMPVDVSMIWQPTKNMALRFSFTKNSGSSYAPFSGSTMFSGHTTLFPHEDE